MNKKVFFLSLLSIISLTGCNNNENEATQPNKYLVQFDSNGGSFVSSVLIEEGKKVTKPSDPVKENYIFDGWLLDAKDYDFSSGVTCDFTLKATWIDALPPDNYSFVFHSDYCSLGNKTVYESNEDISLTLTLGNEFKNAYVLPDDIRVFIGDRLGENGVDYSYNSSTGAFTAKATNNFLVDVMVENSQNYYRVSEDAFNKAVKLENVDYVQREYVYILYTDNIFTETVFNDYYSPTVNHFVQRSVEATMHPNIRKYETYQTIDDDKAYEYYDNGDGFKKSVINKGDYRDSSLLNLEYVLNLASVTYDTIKDKFNEKLLAYVFEVTNKDNEPFDVVMSFEGNSIKYLNYESKEGYVKYIGYASYTFLNYTPELPDFDL